MKCITFQGVFPIPGPWGIIVDDSNNLVEPGYKRIYNSMQQGDNNVDRGVSPSMNNVKHIHIDAMENYRLSGTTGPVRPYRSGGIYETADRIMEFRNLAISNEPNLVWAKAYFLVSKTKSFTIRVDVIAKFVSRTGVTSFRGGTLPGGLRLYFVDEVLEFLQSKRLSWSPRSTRAVTHFSKPGSLVWDVDTVKESLSLAIANANPLLNARLGDRLLKTTNALEYSVEALTLIKSLISGRFWGELPKYTGQAAKDIANLYLRFQYGERLFIQDSKQILDVLNGTRKQLNRKGVVSAKGYTNLCRVRKILYFDGKSTMLPFIQGFNATLNPSNIWDLIPYSFVVDWFLPVDQALDFGPAMADEMLIRSHCITAKTQWFYTDTEGSLYEITGFQRSVGQQGKLSSSLEYSTPNWQQTLSGASLIVQRKR